MIKLRLRYKVEDMCTHYPPRVMLETLACIHKEVGIMIFTVAMLVGAWKPPKCPSIREWKTKIQYIHPVEW